VKNHQTKYLPSDCLTIDSILELDSAHVNVGTTAHVAVSLAILFLLTPFIVLKNHHTIILPSSSGKNELTVSSANVHENVSSILDQYCCDEEIVIVIQLAQLLTHNTCVHADNHAHDGTIVHILSVTLAVHTTAHQVHNVIITNDPFTFPVPDIHGYAVANFAQDHGCVIVNNG
jgi:hypothetical protein